MHKNTSANNRNARPLDVPFVTTGDPRQAVMCLPPLPAAAAVEIWACQRFGPPVPRWSMDTRFRCPHCPVAGRPVTVGGVLAVQRNPGLWDWPCRLTSMRARRAQHLAQQEALMISEKDPGTSPVRRSACSGAEARGFEPRMGANPNRISSAFRILTASRANGRECGLTCGGTRRNCRDGAGSPGRRVRVRAGIVRAMPSCHQATAWHPRCLPCRCAGSQRAALALSTHPLATT